MRESNPDHYYHAEAYCLMAEMISPGVFEYYEDAVNRWEEDDKEKIRKAGNDAADIIVPASQEDLESLTQEHFLNSLRIKSPKILG